MEKKTAIEKSNERKKRRTNLDDEIYLLTYTKPYYKDELSLAIYGKKGHPTIITKLKKMAERDPPWIHICKYEKIPKILKKNCDFDFNEDDKRHNLRDYVYANPDILILKITSILGKMECLLSKNEKVHLKNFVTSKNYRLKLQAIIENSYDIENRDVFNSMLNMLMIDVVYYYQLYNSIHEIFCNKGLIEKRSFNFEEIQKNMTGYFKEPINDIFKFDNQLIEKLVKLDYYTSLRLAALFSSFLTYILKYNEKSDELAKKNPELVKINKRKQKKC